MSSLSDAVLEFVAAEKADIAAVWADKKLTASEVVGLGVHVVPRLVDLAQKFTISGSEKKAEVMAAVGALFDFVAPLVDIPWVPEFVESRYIDPQLRVLLLDAADRLIEEFVSRLPKAGAA